MTSLLAQELKGIENTKYWLGAELSKKVSKKLDFSTTLETRFDNNIKLGNTLLDLGTRYKLTKKLSFLARYRITKQFDRYWKNRVGTGFNYNHRIKPFNYSFRTIVQRQYNKLKPPSNEWRNKLRVKYKRKKIEWSPFLYVESFYYFDYRSNYFSGYRIGLGTDYALDKRNSIKFRCVFEKAYEIQGEQTLILQLQYSFEL